MKENKILNIVINSVLVIFIVGVVGYIIYDSFNVKHNAEGNVINNNYGPSEETVDNNKDSALAKIKDGLKKKKDSDNAFLDWNKLDSEKTPLNYNEEVTLNTNKIKIIFTEGDDVYNKLLVNNDSSAVLGSVYYKTIKGSDNKDYLLIGYNNFGEVVKIYNDTGSFIYQFSAGSDELECSLSVNDYKFFAIIDGNIYYHKYVKNSKNGSNIKLEVFKLNINGSVSEESTGITNEGEAAQCA